MNDDIVACVKARGVLQQRVHAIYGDCFRASVATLLALPIDSVPDVRFYGKCVPVPGTELSGEEAEATRVWWSHWVDWFREFNFGLMRVGRGPDGSLWCPTGTVSLGTVVSPRGAAHSVVCVDEVVAWDPSPFQDCYGLSPESLTFLVALDPGRRMTAVVLR